MNIPLAVWTAIVAVMFTGILFAAWQREKRQLNELDEYRRLRREELRAEQETRSAGRPGVQHPTEMPTAI